MSVKVSIIIPCYNQGHFLRDTLASLKSVNGYSYEIIIVNDGSTDKFTNDYTCQLFKEGYNVIFQENKGLPGARNTAIKASKGKYILALDSDNFLMEPYLNEAVDILENNPGISVVYGDAIKFGDVNESWEIGAFNLQRLMLHNYIDACALIRKVDLENILLYDENMRTGLEDWELWLRFAFNGYKFSYLNKYCFKYRVHNKSMSQVDLRRYTTVNEIENYVNLKHHSFMGHRYITANFIKRFKLTPIKIFLKIILICYFPEKYKKKLQQNKIRNGI